MKYFSVHKTWYMHSLIINYKQKKSKNPQTKHIKGKSMHTFINNLISSKRDLKSILLLIMVTYNNLITNYTAAVNNLICSTNTNLN